MKESDLDFSEIDLWWLFNYRQKVFKRNKNEYMTISARGITHYVDNVGDFIKIERWEQEVF